MVELNEEFSSISFNEKISNIRFVHLENEKLLTTASSLDEFPASFSLGVDIDLFNIKANYKYQIHVFFLGDGQLDEQLIHVSNVYIHEEEFIFSKNNYGITTGSFIFGLTPKKQGDYRITLKLVDAEYQKVLDEFHQYIYLYKR